MAGVLARRDGPPYPASGEGSQHGEVPPVLREVGALRGLDAHGKAGEAPVAQQPAEGPEAEAAPADVLVAIEPPAERALRVVQVERDDPVDAQLGVELGERGRVPGGRAQVVARGEGVLGVEADAQPLAPARLGREPPELREAPADLRPLSGRVLERDGGGEAAAGLQHLAERACRGAQSRVLARAAVRARMRDQVRDAEALAALELGDQLTHRARPQRFDWRRRVGQVGVVREQRPDAGRRARRREGAHLVLGERTQRPLPCGAREELHRLAVECPPALEGEVEPARDRLMGAEERAGARRWWTCISAGQAAPWLQAAVAELKLAWGRGGSDATGQRPMAAGAAAEARACRVLGSALPQSLRARRYSHWQAKGPQLNAQEIKPTSHCAT